MKTGLLLVNLGTPENPDPQSIRRYLKQFLADKRVINLSAPLRYLLLYAFILPFRPRKSAPAYQAIWTSKGSPLLIHSENLKNKLQKRLGDQYQVELGMRYGKPNLESALIKLRDCEHIIVLPLYPQYSSATTGSSIVKVWKILAKRAILPSMSIIRDFHQHPGFIQAQTELIKPYLANHDYVLFSYHGVPENHLLIGECKTSCIHSCSSLSPNNSGCYRAQCLRTSLLLAKALKLNEHQYDTSFQSRLGKTPWIKPYTDEILPNLALQGIKRLAIACPSFTADCLETLEEIGIRAQKQWLQLGGEALTLIPCVNDSERWIEGILAIADLKASSLSK